MPFGVIDYDSGTLSIHGFSHLEHESDFSLEELAWIAECFIHPEHNTTKCDHYVALCWDFKWNTRNNPEIAGFNGYIHFTWKTIQNENYDEELPVKLRKESQVIERKLHVVHDYATRRHEYSEFSYRIHLVPVYADRNIIRDKFSQASWHTDAALVVDNKKLYVNKATLSYYSEFFNSLFNTDFKEKTMSEIPMSGVDFDDLARLLSIVHREPTFPTVKTAPKLLELADRYLMPVVTSHVENFLVCGSWRGMKHSEVIYLADNYHLEKLLTRVVDSIDNQLAVEEITRTDEYEKLTNDTKVMLFHRLLKLREPEQRPPRMPTVYTRRRPNRRAACPY